MGDSKGGFHLAGLSGTDRAAFVELVGGRSLTGLGVSLTVSGSGKIGGRAFGRDVTGQWTWDQGYFCRTMQAGEQTVPRFWSISHEFGSFRCLFKDHDVWSQQEGDDKT